MKKILVMLMAVVMVLSCVAFVPATAAGIDEGMTFNTDNLNRPYDKMETVPLTYEAEIYIPASYATKRQGTIFSNYQKAGLGSVCFQLRENGKPKGAYPSMYIIDSKGTAKTLSFLATPLPTEEWVHVTVTMDIAGKKLDCYVNGVHTETLEMGYDCPGISFDNNPNVMAIGGDFRSGNSQNFKGGIKSIKVFDDIRTADEIAADYAGTGNTEGLLAYYDLTEYAGKKYALNIEDKSGNGFTTYATNSDTDPDLGYQFYTGNDFETLGKFETIPATIEASFFFHKGGNHTAGGSGIVGTYANGSDPAWRLQLDKAGLLSLIIDTPDDLKYEFSNVKFFEYEGVWTYISVVRDEAAKTLSLYVNGELKQTIENFELPAGLDLSSRLGVCRLDGGNNFRGSIKAINLYSDVRTADEIAAFASGAAADSDNLIAAYAPTPKTLGVIKNQAGDSNYDLLKIGGWVATAEAPANYDYSIAVVGDSSKLASSYADGYNGLYDWLAANAKSKKIGLVVGTGDIGAGDYGLVAANLAKLDGVVEYAIARGNGEELANFTSQSFKNATKYASTLEGMLADRIANTYKTVKMGGVDYLIINLDVAARDAALEWAAEVIEQYPNHTVIINTHVFLNSKAGLSKEGDADAIESTPVSPVNNGQAMFDKLVRKYSNISLVLTANASVEKVLYTYLIGDHGNRVTILNVNSALVDTTYEGAGMVAMLYFSNGGKTVDLQYYSTMRDQYFQKPMTISVDVMEAGEEFKGPKTEDEPVESEPVESEPVESEPVESDPAESNSESDSESESESETTPTVEEPKEGGIIGWVIGGVVVVIAVVAAALGLKKKKN